MPPAVVAVDDRRDAHRRPVLRAAVVLQVRPPGRVTELRHPDLGQQLALADRRLEDAGEEVGRCDRSLASRADDHELGVEREHHGREVGRRVAVRERAADRAAMPHLRVADLAGGRGDDRAVLLEERIAVHGGMSRERADREL